MRLRLVKHVRRKEKVILCAVDLEILMGEMPDCHKENWEFKEQGC